MMMMMMTYSVYILVIIRKEKYNKFNWKDFKVYCFVSIIVEHLVSVYIYIYIYIYIYTHTHTHTHIHTLYGIYHSQLYFFFKISKSFNSNHATYPIPYFDLHLADLRLEKKSVIKIQICKLKIFFRINY